MHQNPRPAPRSAASASNPATNPERTNNLRDTREAPPQRIRSSVDLASYTERATGAAESSKDAAAAEKDRETSKLNQIIQNFHTKAALMICSSRATLPQAYGKSGEARQNKWFNVVLNETEALLEDLQDWRRPDLHDDPPPPLEIEVYLDASQISQTQALTIVDEQGKRWDVADSLRTSADSSPRLDGAPEREIVLERWTIEMGEASRYKATQLNDALPNVYKKGVVLFRSLFTFSRLLPAWKLHRRLSRQPSSVQPLKLRFRIRQGGSGSLASLDQDPLQTPLCPTDLHDSDTNITEHHAFPPLLCAAGPLSISVDYRTNCDLYIADAEALLSSRFAGLDAFTSYSEEAGSGAARHRGDLDFSSPRGDIPSSRPRGLARAPDLHHRDLLGGGRSVPLRSPPVGSSSRGAREAGLAGGALASLGTYHTATQRQSPVSALQHRATGSDSSSMDDKPSNRGGTPQSIPKCDFLKNPPFKAGSVATSPRNAPSPSTSAPRPTALPSSSFQSKRLSLNTLPQQALRNPIMTEAPSPGSSSPKPTPVQRYSSSFANRKKYTRPGESTTSSGRGSSSSKEKSGNIEGTPGSSGSVRTDEDDIAAFISTVERSKDAFSSPARNNTPSTINLAKFKGMTTASSELADEMSSSSLIQTSLTPPSRRLSNVPGLSVSSSPSRAMAHAPHVRSRLSTQSIAEEREERRELERAQEESDEDEPFIFQQDNLED
ncbi:autophagy protein 13 [Oleoguttula sp. CCFEE 5521]